MEAADFTTKYADNIFLTVYDAVQTAENSLRSEVKVDEMVSGRFIYCFNR